MKLLKISSLAVQPEWETVGRWIDFHGFDEPTRFHVKALSNPEYVAALKIAQMQNADKYRDGVPDDVAAVTMGRLLAEHILCGWEGIEPAYTPETALTLLSDPVYRLLTGAVLACATKAGAPKAEYVDAPPARRKSRKEA